MDHDASPPAIELHSVGDFSSPYHLRSTSQTSLAYHLHDRSIMSPSPMGDEYDRSRPQSPLSTNENPLLQAEPFPPDQRPIDAYANGQMEPRAAATKGKRWLNVLYCLPHMVPLVATITILILNARGVYWQDLGRPNQNTILQVLQYAAKAHELTMAASLTAIVVHQIQYDLSNSKGVSLGFLTAGFRLSDPSYVCTREFLGGAMARVHSRGMSRFSALTYLLVLGVALTLVVGPSSAIAMIPRLNWWEVSKMDAFGPLYTDRLYFNRTEAELWPRNITNAIYADVSNCDAIGTDPQDCAVGAADVVGPWVSLHQSQGTKPNITIFQDSEVTRYLTSQGGPPDNSSFTVSSTIGSIFAKDLDHYWDWLVENSSLPLNIDRPLLRPAFKDSNFKMKKPLVSAQCQTYFNPDYERGAFEFPHDELVTPPLDEFKDDIWSLPTDFVLNLKGNDSDIGNLTDLSHPYMLFNWFDTATEFSNKGAPSLGAVVIYLTTNGTDLLEVLTACSFDGRWAPVEYYLDPKDVVTVYQDSPNPMDILNGSNKAAAKDLIQMKMSLEWAKTLNVKGSDQDIPSTTVVEQMLEGFSGVGLIDPEPEPTLGYVMKSIDWRLSTTLGLYLTESLAHAFSDVSKGSMLYRQAPELNQSYVRYLNDINQPALKRFYTNGKLAWVEMRDPLWNSSFPPWDEWAPQNGYTEIIFTVQRNGYGYGFEGVPIKLAALVLAIYVLLVCGHVVSVLFNGQVYKGYSTISDMVALAWNSAPAREVSDVAAGTEKLHTWSLVVKTEEKDQRPRLVLESMETTVIR